MLGRSVASSSSPTQRGRATHGHIPTVVIPQQIRFLHCSAHSSTQSINQSVSTRSRKFRQQSPKPPGSVRPNANLLAHLNPPRSSPKPTTTIQVAKSIPLRPFLFQFGLNLSKNQLIPTNYAPSFRHHQILVPHTTYLTSPSPPLPLLQQPATLRAGNVTREYSSVAGYEGAHLLDPSPSSSPSQNQPSYPTQSAPQVESVMIYIPIGRISQP